MGEFGLLQDLLREGGTFIVGLQRELPTAAQQEVANEAQRRASYNTPDQIGRGRNGDGLQFREVEAAPTAEPEWVERDHEAGDEW